MALASLGALVAMSATASLNSRSRRDFAEEWNESLRVKSAAPLNENAHATVKNAKRRRSARGSR
jgi:putative membrane protein